MNTPDYLALLRQKKQSIKPLEGTAQTAKSPLRSLCSSPLAHIQPEKPVASLAGADATTIDSVVGPQNVRAGNTVTASRWWLIHYLDRDPVEVACCPEATHADILERHPDAVAAEPFTPTVRQPSAPMTASEETAIQAWLALIEETDPATITEVIGQGQRDADARNYFTRRAAAELPEPDANAVGWLLA